MIFGQSWAQERAQRLRLEKRCMNQRKLAREIDSKAPGYLKAVWPDFWGCVFQARGPGNANHRARKPGL